jgi:hypothetical protein
VHATLHVLLPSKDPSALLTTQHVYTPVACVPCPEWALQTDGSRQSLGQASRSLASKTPVRLNCYPNRGMVTVGSRGCLGPAVRSTEATKASLAASRAGPDPAFHPNRRHANAGPPGPAISSTTSSVATAAFGAAHASFQDLLVDMRYSVPVGHWRNSDKTPNGNHDI